MRQKCRNCFDLTEFFLNGQNSVSVEITEILSHTFLTKISWNQQFYPKKLLKSWFHEIFFQWERISRFSTVCALKKLLKSWFHEIFFQWLLSFSLISCGITLLKENLQKSPVAFMSLSFGCLFFACRFMRRITFCFCCFLLFILELYIKRQSRV